MSDKQARHETISAVAQSHGALRSNFERGVSMHVMPKTVSFFHLRSIINAAKGAERNMFLGVINDELVISINYNYQASSRDANGASKKRKRDPLEDDVDSALSRIQCATIDTATLSNARQVLLDILKLKGERGEKVIESWALTTQKNPANGNPVPRLVLSARITPGVPVSINALKTALGTCFSDGMVTVANPSEFSMGVMLPQKEDSRIAENMGVKSFSLFSTIVASL
jgi:hypothetical protein